MTDVERLIRDLPRPEVPARLDARVAASVDRHERSTPGRGSGIPLWTAAAACLVCGVLGAVLGLALGLRQQAPAPPVVYLLEPNPALQQTLGERAATSSDGFFATQWSNVEAIAPAAVPPARRLAAPPARQPSHGAPSTGGA